MSPVPELPLSPDHSSTVPGRSTTGEKSKASSKQIDAPSGKPIGNGFTVTT